MLRDSIDVAWLEEFVAGLTHSTGMRIGIYESDGSPLVRSLAPGGGGAGDAAGWPPLAARDRRAALAKASEGTAAVAGRGGGARAIAAVMSAEDAIGFTSASRGASGPGIPNGRADEAGQERTAAFCHWLARVLAFVYRRESRARAMREELSLVGAVANLLTGQEGLQAVLERIARDTARVMQCQAASIRLLNRDTGELELYAVHNLSDHYLGKGRVLRHENPIDEAALRGEMVYVANMQRDARVRFREAARRAGIVSGLITGMIYRGQAVGVLRVYSDYPRDFRRYQQELLRSVATQVAAAILNTELVQQRLRDAEMNRQLALAGEVQSRMIRVAQPRHPRLDVAMVYEPSFRVGGDFCDVLALPDGRVCLAVGDVAGKGIPASLVMASVRAALRATSESTSDLGQIAERLNRQIVGDAHRGEFVTLVLAAVDRDARWMEICNAGHEPVRLVRGRRILVVEGAGGLPLGADEGETYRASRHALRGGDFVLLCTDGVVEANDFEGRLFGRERLRRALAQYARLAPRQILRSIQWDIRRFAGLAEQSDDVTMLGFRVLPAGVDGGCERERAGQAAGASAGEKRRRS